MRKELVNQHIKYFTDLDLNVQVVQMNPLAVYNAMYYDERLADGTTMIIDLGAENTDLIIADGETIWLRSIPIGGNNFTEALVKAFKLNFAKAEDLKRNAATSKYARQIFQAMRPIFADLVAEIQRSIGFYASVHRDSRIKQDLALGGTFRLPGLQKYLQQNLQLDVERLDSLGAGAADRRPKLAAALNENIAVDGRRRTAWRCRRWARGRSQSRCCRGRSSAAKMWKEKTKWFAAAAAICVAAVGVKYGMYAFRRGPLRLQREPAAADRRVGRRGGGPGRQVVGDRVVRRAGQDPHPQRQRACRDLPGHVENIWADIAKSLPAQNGRTRRS